MHTLKLTSVHVRTVQIHALRALLNSLSKGSHALQAAVGASSSDSRTLVRWPDEPWRTKGHAYLGHEILREAKEGKKTTDIWGKIVGFLPAEEADFKVGGLPAALWHVAYEDGKDAEDLEEHQVKEALIA